MGSVPGVARARRLVGRSSQATFAVCISLAVLVTLQAPGRITADTKLDLYTDPADFLRRATRLWDGRTAFGYVPNQQWGYLFPSGPFFWLGRNLGLQTWVVQRAWLSAILIMALLGALRLATELGIGTASTRIVAATSYALSPTMLSHIGHLSAGAPLGLAALPWVVIPLVSLSRRGKPSTAAVASAVAFAAGGAVNATVALLVLPLPALYLLTRRRSRARGSILRWWSAAIAVASIGPIVGLALLRQFGLDFTKITESASQTAATLNATDVVRGSSDWLSYFSLGKPWSPAGQLFVHSVPVLLAVGLVTALGIAGLASSDLPERRWLSLTFGLGFVGQAIAYRGVWAGPFAADVQQLLDGPLVVLRNLSKLGGLVALPLALGLGHVLASFHRPRVRQTVLWSVTAAMMAATLPVATGRLLPSGSFTGLPSYWREFASFQAQDPNSRALLTPSASFGEYTWGRTLDEPLQSIGRAPFVVGALYPGGGSLPASRLLDQIDARLSRGEPVPGLAATLSRFGIRFVVLRADLDRSRTGVVEPGVIAAALDATNGIVRAQSFGPVVDSTPSADRLLSRTVAPIHALEVYEVLGAAPLATTQPADPVRLIGGLESILNREVAKFVGNRAVLVDADGAALQSTQTIVADGLRLRDRNFGDVRGNLNSSYTLGANEVPVGSQRLVPVDLTNPSESLSIAGDDEAHISASSSFGSLARLPEAQPYAAFDANQWTSWMPDPLQTDGTGEWIQATFATPRKLQGLTIRLLLDVPTRPTIAKIRIVTEQGSRSFTMRRTFEPQEIAILPGSSSFLRLEILSVDGIPGGSSQVGIAELAIPGLAPRRPLIVPKPRANDASSTSFFFERTSTPLLNPARWAEEPLLDRLFSSSSKATYDLVVTGSLRQPTSSAIIQKFSAEGPVAATASSSWFGRSSLSASGAIDADLTTAWVADPYDPEPTLTVSWKKTQTVSGITISATGAPNRTPTEILVTATNYPVQRVTLINGKAALSTMRTREIKVSVLQSDVPFGVQSLATPSAVAIQEITFAGASGYVDRRMVPKLSCGSGPTVRIDGLKMKTRPVASIDAVLSGGPVALQVCGDSAIVIGPGLHRLDEVGGGPFALSSASLIRTTSRASTAQTRSIHVTQWDDSTRTLTAGSGPTTILAISENFNPGWHAMFRGVALPTLRLDGWRQGWLIPAGEAGEIRLSFGPTSTFRIAIVVWIVAFVLFVGLAWAFARRRCTDCELVGYSGGPTRIGDVAAVVAIGLTGGIAVLVVAAVRYLRRDPIVHRLVAFGAFALSTIVSAVGNDAQPGSSTGAFSGFAQLSALVAVSCVLVAVTNRPANGNPHQSNCNTIIDQSFKPSEDVTP